MGSADTEAASHKPDRKSSDYAGVVPHYRISEAAELLGVSDDTMRRWVDAGRVGTVPGTGPREVPGRDLARLAQELATAPETGAGPSSARNRLVGLVTKVTADGVMAQVELQCGAFRVVSLISAEAVNELGLEPGVRAVATVKATNVVVEVPR